MGGSGFFPSSGLINKTGSSAVFCLIPIGQIPQPCIRGSLPWLSMTLTKLTLGRDVVLQFRWFPDPDQVLSTDAERVLVSFEQTACLGLGHIRCHAHNALPETCATFSLLDDVRRDVRTTVVMRRRPADGNGIWCYVRGSEVRYRTRFVYG